MKNREVRSIVITGYGTNCEMEMAHACRLAGSEIVDIVHINELINGEKSFDDYHFLNLPGGFLDGDDLGSAKAGANRIQYAKVAGKEERLYDQLLRFIHAGKHTIETACGTWPQMSLMARADSRNSPAFPRTVGSRRMLN